jgi:hypothetical protein
MMRKLTIKTLRFQMTLFLAAALQLQCGSAPSGFYAPLGSNVTLPDATDIETDEDYYISVSALVTDKNSLPLNGVFLSFTCTHCDLFDKADGESTTLADPTRVQSVANPYVVKTDKRGTYTVVIRVQAPSNRGVSDYTAKLVADIGGVGAEYSVTVTQPSTGS